MTAVSQTVKVQSFPNSDLYGNAVLTNRQALYNLNQALTAAGVVTATTAAKIKTVNTLTYLIDGAFKTKAGTDNFWTLTGAVVPASSFTKYLLLIDGAGAATVLQSSVNQVSLATCIYPSYPDGFCVVGVFTVATDATHTWTPGTTTTASGSGITSTFQDGLDKALLPLLADANNAAQILQLSGGANTGSLLL